MVLGKYGRNPGWTVVALAAFVYGVGVALLALTASEQTTNTWTLVGSGIVGVLFVALMVVPFVLWLSRGGSATRPERHKVG